MNARLSNLPKPSLMGLLERYMTWQGGGAYVYGTANFLDCTFRNNLAGYVSARFLNLPKPSPMALMG